MHPFIDDLLTKNLDSYDNNVINTLYNNLSTELQKRLHNQNINYTDNLEKYCNCQYDCHDMCYRFNSIIQR